MLAPLVTDKTAYMKFTPCKILLVPVPYIVVPSGTEIVCSILNFPLGIKTNRCFNADVTA
jgi:hypothetical protein